MKDGFGPTTEKRAVSISARRYKYREIVVPVGTYAAWKDGYLDEPPRPEQ